VRGGLTVGPCGKIAGLTEQKATAQPDTGAGEESFRSHPGQLPDPPIGTVSHGVSFCAIGIRGEATACPASPMPKATSRTSARRRASGPCLIGTGFMPSQAGGSASSRSRDPERPIGYGRSRSS
jgi:hypothetical protein